MTTDLIKLIHQDAEEWCSLDREARYERFVHWYSHHFQHVGAAFAAAPGHKLVVTVPTLSGFEQVESRLNAFADIIAVRDGRGPIKGGPPFVAVPDERSETEFHRGGQIEKLLRQISVGPLPIVELEIAWYWTSSEKRLIDGRVAHEVVAMNEMCHWNKDVYDWWEGSSLRKNGQVLYAPFLATPEMEAEAIRQEFSIYSRYNAFLATTERDLGLITSI